MHLPHVHSSHHNYWGMSARLETSPPPQGPNEPSKGGWTPSLGVAFRLLLAARLVSVFFMHISDCDETFNYWEPFHYVLYGSGFQTWEYSPVYALRSYGYILLHVVPMLLTRTDNKLVVFFLTRVVLAVFCTLSEFYFYRAVLQVFGPRVARWMLLFMVCGCGMFVSAAAFLPSSFAMYFTMIAMGAWFLKNYPLAIFGVAVSAVVGWPFSAALGIPIVVDLLYNKKEFLYFLLWSFLSFIVTAVPLMVVDSMYYGKFGVCTPLNIIVYNIFGKGGPSLYGIEPWTFYFVNGLINFNVVFLLALMAVPLIELKVLSEAFVVSASKPGTGWGQRVFSMLLLYSAKDKSSLPSRKYRVAGQSMLIWILIFFTRPHKEERFLFPIYPLFYLTASIVLCLLPDLVLELWRYVHAPRVLRTASRALLVWFPSITGAVYILLSLSRIMALYKGYHAPLSIYTHLNSPQVLTIVQPIYSDLNVCVGKEWYRFPSSFYLPSSKWHLRFIQSEFRGQLPQPYGNHSNATWVVPDNMNDMNLEEPSRYFDVEDCHFLVDSTVGGGSSELEPCYFCNTEHWMVVFKRPFLDASRSPHRLLRAFYMPSLSTSYNVYADYMLLLNKQKFRKIISKLTPDYDTSFI